MTRKTSNKGKEICGIIMPISASDGYSQEHWKEVKTIIESTIKSAGFIPKMVSEGDDTGIIHKRIVSNICTNPIVVCDVSSKNANVMFELGLRLGVQKPIVLIKDDATDFSFDIGIMEHLSYPKSLRYEDITKFKNALKNKIKATVETSEPGYLEQFHNPNDINPIKLEDLRKKAVKLKELYSNGDKADSNLASYRRNDIKPYFAVGSVGSSGATGLITISLRNKGKKGFFNEVVNANKNKTFYFHPPTEGTIIDEKELLNINASQKWGNNVNTVDFSFEFRFSDIDGNQYQQKVSRVNGATAITPPTLVAYL